MAAAVSPLRTAWHWAAAVLLRLALAAAGASDVLLWRPEVTTPANSVLSAREGLRLLQLGLQPYAGTACATPPLWMALLAPLARRRVLWVLPNVAADLVGAAALMAAAAALFAPQRHAKQQQQQQQQHVRDAPWLQPRQLALLYLFHPFAVASCVAGTSTSAENAAVMLALAGGVSRSGPLAGAGLAAGAYLGLHPLLLLLPLLLLMWRGPEDVLQHVPGLPPLEGGSSNDNSSSIDCNGRPEGAAEEPDAAASKQEQQLQGKQHQRQEQEARQGQRGMQQQQQQQQRASSQGSTRGCVVLLASLLACAACLALLSDVMLQRHPDAQCLPALLRQLPGGSWAKQQAQQQQQAQAEAAPLAACWAGRVYGLPLLLRDFTPNIGLFWYFFTEMFTAFRPFFLFVFHSFAVILALPAALRFPARPLLLAWLQLFIGAMFRPYACVGHLVPWSAALPLLQQQLQVLPTGLFFANALALLLVLGPAMWQQWIVADAANANFFYSITLLLGAWQTVFVTQLLRATVLLDRRLGGKELAAALRAQLRAQRQAGCEGDDGSDGAGAKDKQL